VTNKRNDRAKRQRKTLIERFGGKCQNPNCGSTSELQFAHVEPTKLSAISRGRGRKERLSDVSKHPECYALLCEECHRAFDSGAVLPEDMGLARPKNL
jgi:hypothetical protein